MPILNENANERYDRNGPRREDEQQESLEHEILQHKVDNHEKRDDGKSCRSAANKVHFACVGEKYGEADVAGEHDPSQICGNAIVNESSSEKDIEFAKKKQ